MLIITLIFLSTGLYPPRDLSAKILSGKEATLDWNPPHEGRFNSYKIDLEPLTPQDDTGIRTINVGLEDSTPVFIRDLTPGASYEVRLRTVYRNEESKSFARINFTTTPSAPAEPAIWFRNETTLLVKIQPTTSEAIFDHYRVSIQPDDTDGDSVQVVDRPEQPGKRVHVVFNGLQPGKQYNISVQTISLGQASEPSSGLFRTVPLAPVDSFESSSSSEETQAVHERSFDFSGAPVSRTPAAAAHSAHSAPIFTNGGPPPDLTFLDGRDAEIQCEATGSPYPTVEWYYSPTTERDKRRRIDLTSSTKYAANAHGALSITQLEKGDEGYYTCIRSNLMGSIDGTTKLNVIVRTQIDQPPVDSKVILSSTAELQCRVRHDPSVQVKIYWTFNKRNLTTSSRIKMASDGTLKIEQVCDGVVHECNIDD